MYTRDLYGRLEAATGHGTGFEPLGFIGLAADMDRVEEYRRVAAFNRMCGNDVEEIGRDAIKNLFPLARVDDLPRPYRTWGYPVEPALFVAASPRILVNTVIEKPLEAFAGIGLMALGMPVHLLWRRRDA